MSLMNTLKKVEIYARIFSLIAIPVLIAIGGWVVQNNLSNQALKGEYVKVAISVLKEKPSKENIPLKRWAATILNKYSEVKLSKNELVLLRTGKAMLPPSYTFEYSPDGTIIKEIIRLGNTTYTENYSNREKTTKALEKRK